MEPYIWDNGSMINRMEAEFKLDRIMFSNKASGKMEKSSFNLIKIRMISIKESQSTSIRKCAIYNDFIN